MKFKIHFNMLKAHYAVGNSLIARPDDACYTEENHGKRNNVFVLNSLKELMSLYHHHSHLYVIT